MRCLVIALFIFAVWFSAMTVECQEETDLQETRLIDVK